VFSNIPLDEGVQPREDSESSTCPFDSQASADARAAAAAAGGRCSRVEPVHTD